MLRFTLSYPELTFEVSADARFGALMLPFACPELPEGVAAYQALEVNNGEVVLSLLDAPEAYKPFIVYAPDGCALSFEGTADADAFPESGVASLGALSATVCPIDLENVFTLSSDASPALFVRSDAIKARAGEAFLAEVETDADDLPFSLGKETAAPLTTADDADTPLRLYDLLGRPVAAPARGTITVSTDGKHINF